VETLEVDLRLVLERAEGELDMVHSEVACDLSERSHSCSELSGALGAREARGLPVVMSTHGRTRPGYAYARDAQA
jgi:hypothetical protein